MTAVSVYVHIYMHTYICVYVYVYIYMYVLYRHMCVTGIVTAIDTMEMMISELLQQQKFMLMYKFSQDHLELFFNAIRGAGKCSMHLLLGKIFECSF